LKTAQPAAAARGARTIRRRKSKSIVSSWMRVKSFSNHLDIVHPL
jgi:hypothetical protein